MTLGRELQWLACLPEQLINLISIDVDKFFTGKRILFIAPKFFGYEKEIKSRLESLGAHVDFYDDRPSNSAFSKIAIRLMPMLQRRRIRDYFSAIVESSAVDYDFVFIIKMECMPSDILR